MTGSSKLDQGFVAAAPSSADIGIVAALPIEVAPFRERLKEPRSYAALKFSIVEGIFRDKIIAMVLTGPGRSRAEQGARLLIDGHRPRWLLSVGFAGSLDPRLGRNEILLANEVVNIEGNRFRIDVHGQETQGLRIGTLLTVDEIVRTSAEKQELHRRFGAIGVDMETSSVAAFCGVRGQKFLSIRVISDDVQHDLPPEVLSILGPSGGFRLGATLGSLWKRPAAIKDLLQLREHAHEAARRLDQFLAGAITQLD